MSSLLLAHLAFPFLHICHCRRKEESRNSAFVKIQDLSGEAKECFGSVRPTAGIIYLIRYTIRKPMNFCILEYALILYFSHRKRENAINPFHLRNDASKLNTNFQEKSIMGGRTPYVWFPIHSHVSHALVNRKRNIFSHHFPPGRKP